MSGNKADPLYKYLSLAGGLAVAYFTINYFASGKSLSKSTNTIPLDRTRKILQQIKYQMYANSISFSEGVNTKLKTKFSLEQLQDYLRKQMTKVYESKEELIISKYSVSKQDLSAALLAHKNDRQIIKNQKEIIDMMNRAVSGQLPDLTVPESALKLLNLQQVRQVYRQVCELIAVKVWEKLTEKKKNDPSFNCKDDNDYKKAIRELSIYDLKVEFLQRKGFRKEWGCPNEVFLKVMETKKSQNQQFKTQTMAIEKGYETLIQVISHSPESVTRQSISQTMDDFIKGDKSKVAEPRVQRQAPPPPKVQQPVFSSVSSKKAVPQSKPKQEEDDFDMQKLMMEELLKRSQQEPPVELKTESVEVKPQTVSEVKPQKVQIKSEVVEEVKPEVETVKQQVDAKQESEAKQLKSELIEIKQEQLIIADGLQTGQQQVQPEVIVQQKQVQKPQEQQHPLQSNAAQPIQQSTEVLQAQVEGQHQEEAHVDQLAPEEQIQAPLQEQVQAPLQEQVQAPLQEQVQAPLQEQVQAPLQEQVQAPLQEQVQAPPAQQEEQAQAPHVQQEVQAPVQQQVQAPAQQEVQAPPSQQEVQAPAAQGEVQQIVNDVSVQQKVYDIAASQQPQVLQQTQQVNNSQAESVANESSQERSHQH